MGASASASKKNDAHKGKYYHKQKKLRTVANAFDGKDEGGKGPQGDAVTEELTEAELHMREAQKRKTAIMLIQRNMRAWKARKNDRRRAAVQKRQREMDKERREKQRFREANDMRTELEQRQADREHRGKAWLERGAEDREAEEAARLRALREKEQAAKKKVEDRVDKMTAILSKSAAAEQEAYTAGFKSPHVLVVERHWEGFKAGSVLTDAELQRLYTEAARDVAIDGYPVKVVAYDWEVSSLELMGMIKDKIAEDHPKLRARSFTFLVCHGFGGLFLMKFLPTTHVGILGGTWKNGKQTSEKGGSLRVRECQGFWLTISQLLSSYRDPDKAKKEAAANKVYIDPLAQELADMKNGVKHDLSSDIRARVHQKQEEDKMGYDRDDNRVVFMLGHAKMSLHDAGKTTLDALEYVFHGAPIMAPLQGSPAMIEHEKNLFDETKYHECVKHRLRMIKTDELGYDPWFGEEVVPGDEASMLRLNDI